MAGTAFLPWERWLAQLLHPIVVAIRRWVYAKRRQRSLSQSEGWKQTQGTVQLVNWDIANPREEILYVFSAENGGYFSGSYWRWFDSSEAREVRVGDRVELRYDQRNPESSVFIKFV